MDGEVVGFAYMQYEPVLYAELAVKVACLHDIFVEESERRQEIGKMLLDAVANEARGFGATKVLLSVAAKNEGAKAFFERSGFYPTMHEMMLVLD
jgi:GNAT superfamily N-acetyltransferase